MLGGGCCPLCICTKTSVPLATKETQPRALNRKQTPEFLTKDFPVCNQVSNGNSYQGEPGQDKNCRHCNFQDLHSPIKENPVALVINWTHPTKYLQLFSQTELERQTLDPIGHVIHSMPCRPCSKHMRWLWNGGPARLLIKNSLPRLQFLCLSASFLRFVCSSWVPQGFSPSAALSQVRPHAALHSENSGRPWLFLESARGNHGKLLEKCFPHPEMLSILGFRAPERQTCR